MKPIRLELIDGAILVVYFAFVLGIGFVLKRYMRSSTDFFLSGRLIPTWVAGLAFLSANLGAQEVIGMAASGAKYGIMTSHFYWVGAIPAMVFVAVFMMPFYYGSKARSVPEYLKMRFDEKTRALNAMTFAGMTVFSSGISMYAMALLLNLILGWDFNVSVWLSAIIVLLYISLGGLTSAIYNEVMQFFLIVAGFAPLVFLPGMIAIALTQHQGASGFALPSKPDGSLNYDLVIPLMLRHYFPSGILGLGLTALMASFMSGMAGNVTAFNTVWTYDIYQAYLRPRASDSGLLWMGRASTVVGIVISVGAAYFAAHFNNIMDLLQLVFAFVNAPLFATFLLGMFWRRTTGHAAFVGLLSGILAAAVHHGLTQPMGAHTLVKGG